MGSAACRLPADAGVGTVAEMEREREREFVAERMVAEGVENVHRPWVCVVCIKGENTARLGRDTLHAVKRRPVHPILLSLPTGAAFIQKNLRTTLREGRIGTRGPQSWRWGVWGRERERRG